jgi:uncharacterized delta-60 repeat protein
MPNCTALRFVGAFVFASATLLSACGGGGSSGGTTMPPPQGPPGTLDTSFGNGGIAITSFSAYAAAGAMVVQPDGKIIAAGLSSDNADGSGMTSFSLARYNVNGMLDSSFGNGGKVVTSLGPGHAYAASVALQSDGKIVAAGSYDTGVPNGVACALVRYNADGTVDTGFGVGGSVLAVRSDGVFMACAAVAVQADGKIVTAATSFAYSVVLRLNADGSRDLSFGVAGEVLTPCGRSCLAHAVMLQPDGKIVVVVSGYVILPLTYQVTFVVTRYDANGALDQGFGVGGFATSPKLPSAQADATNAVLQSDGKIVMVGQNYSSLQPENTFGVSRFLADGTPDPAFGSGGIVATAIPGSGARGNAVALQPNNKIVVASDIWVTTDPQNNHRLMLTRYDAHGVPDTSFGPDGNVVTSIGSSAQPIAMTVQPDGRIVVAGAASAPQPSFFVARYFGD